MFTINFTFNERQRTASVTKDKEAFVEFYKVKLEDGSEKDIFIPVNADQWCERMVGFTLLARTIGAAIREHQHSKWALSHKVMMNYRIK